MRPLLALLLLVFAPATAFGHPAVGVVMDSRGIVYYSDLTNVWQIARDGTRSIAVPHVHSHELYIDAADNLYGEHLWYEGDATKKWGYRVWRLAPDGRITDVIPATEGFRSHYSFVRDAAGSMYFADSGVIRKRTVQGIQSVVSKGPFTDLRWMAVSADGTLYLIDNGRLLSIAPNAAQREIVHDLRARSVTRLLVDKRHSVMGLYPDGHGNVYVARYGTGEVLRVSNRGDITTVAKSTMPWSPSGVLLTAAGDLYVLEFSTDNRARVKKVTTSSATPGSSRAPEETPRTSSPGSTAPTHRSPSRTSPSSAR